MKDMQSESAIFVLFIDKELDEYLRLRVVKDRRARSRKRRQELVYALLQFPALLSRFQEASLIGLVT